MGGDAIPMHSGIKRTNGQTGQFLTQTLALLLLAFLLMEIYKVSGVLNADFLEYFAAGSVYLRGGNPYSAADLLALERQIDREKPEALMMFNPPWTLILILPFCMLPFELARALWIFSLALILLFSANWIWRSCGGHPAQRWISWLAVPLFLPAFHALILGQLSSVVLGGLIGFAATIERKKYLLAGFFCLPIATKPHLVFLFWIVLILWSYRERCWLVPAGAAIALGGSSIILSIWDHGLIPNYVALMSSGQMLKWVTPTSGMLLRVATDFGEAWLQFIPSVLGMGACMYLWYFRWKRCFSWRSHLIPILLLSSLTTFFAWTHDMAVLLPCVLVVLIWFRRDPARNFWLLIVLVLSDVLYIRVLWVTNNSFFTLWMPWILTALYVCRCRFDHEESTFGTIKA
jgi:hypothetical protein